MSFYIKNEVIGCKLVVDISLDDLYFSFFMTNSFENIINYSKEYGKKLAENIDKIWENFNPKNLDSLRIGTLEKNDLKNVLKVQSFKFFYNYGLKSLYLFFISRKDIEAKLIELDKELSEEKKYLSKNEYEVALREELGNHFGINLTEEDIVFN